MDRPAPRLHAARNGGGGHLRFGPPVMRVVERAANIQRQARKAGQRFIARQQLGGDLPVLQAVLPVAFLGQGGVGGGGKGDAALAIPRLAADAGVQALPQAHGIDHQRHLARVAMGQAHPAPVATGLFARDMALFEQGDPQAPVRQLERGRGADDAAADHHHIDKAGQGRVAGHRIGPWAGHGDLLSGSVGDKDGPPQRPCARLSKASRSPSPIKLNPVTAIVMASPGTIASHGAEARYCWAPFSILPQLGSGGWMP
ncbi:hypothetical protein PANO111632_22080 [Paracoccus nototheniae]